jgi:hypothetical protein
METTMGYYGSDPTPINTEASNEDVTDALEVLQSAGDADQNDQDFGDGFAKRRMDHDC